jgi:type II secretory pathway pseudopilin PulG
VNLRVKEMNMSRKRYTRSQKAFYILSILIVISMVLGLIAVAITPY